MRTTPSRASPRHSPCGTSSSTESPSSQAAPSSTRRSAGDSFTRITTEPRNEGESHAVPEDQGPRRGLPEPDDRSLPEGLPPDLGAFRRRDQGDPDGRRGLQEAPPGGVLLPLVRL